MAALPAMAHADITPAFLAECDRLDPLAAFRDAFDLPDGVVYLDGNSLGALPRRAEQIATKVMHDWRDGLIRSWNEAGWYDLPRRLGGRIAGLIGAAPDEVVMTDSTSVNLFKALAAALRLRPGRRVIVSERDNFPTDLYIAAGLAGLIDRGHELRLVDGPAQIPQALGPDCAVLLLTHVNYRDGRMHDMAAMTSLAHAQGALAVWDLAHSTGAVEVDLTGCQADFAVGCTYKYLNGGPGAPAFVFAARRWYAQCEQPLSGWWGHAAPFGFAPAYRPEAGIGRFLCGTPPVLSMAVAEAGIEAVAEATPARIRAKSIALCETFIALVERDCAGFGLELASPRDPAQRGSQVSFVHRDGYAIMQALAERGVLGDYREPGILRFGFAPLTVRHADVGKAARILHDILSTGAWNQARHLARRAVT